MEAGKVMLSQASCIKRKEHGRTDGQAGRQTAAGISMNQDKNASAHRSQSCV